MIRSEPMLVSELIKLLGVHRHDVSDQLIAVLAWLQEHEPNGFLAAGIDYWLRDPNRQLDLQPGGPAPL